MNNENIKSGLKIFAVSLLLINAFVIQQYPYNVRITVAAIIVIVCVIGFIMEIKY